MRGVVECSVFEAPADAIRDTVFPTLNTIPKCITAYYASTQAQDPVWTLHTIFFSMQKLVYNTLYSLLAQIMQRMSSSSNDIRSGYLQHRKSIDATILPLIEFFISTKASKGKRLCKANL
ncbi:Hypothetical protein NTJ_07068 [Nesidiocoris tenuis]|uniref:Uncharacterized protein n=1 Tax=Nesidiocoris tenuis TaxID=355587 RepID=A0ABN7ASI6_9HEMI|nr:Hypothetical protein NTJ_07068 [Nesidiocoris tenuis]